MLRETAESGKAQFISATNSPILLALPDATILSFDEEPIAPVAYEETRHYTVHREFLNNRERLLGSL